MNCDRKKTLKDLIQIHLITLGGCISRRKNPEKKLDEIDNLMVYNTLVTASDTHGLVNIIWSNLFNKPSSWQIEDTEIKRIQSTILSSPYNLILITCGTGQMSVLGSQLLDVAKRNNLKIIITGAKVYSEESRGFHLGNALAYLISMNDSKGESGVWICWGGVIRKPYVCDEQGSYLLKVHNAFQEVYTLTNKFDL